MGVPILDSAPRLGDSPVPGAASAGESPAFDRPLRIGVLLDSLTAPRWVAKILRDVVEAPFLTLSLVIVDASGTRPPPATWREWFARQRAAAPYRLWEWYQAADYERFRTEEGPDPFEPVDVTALVAGAEVVRVEPLRKGFVDRFRPEDVQRVRDGRVDVTLRFGFRIVKGEILDAAPYGMWSIHHDDNRSYRGGPALFWEMYERNPESGTILQVLTDALDGGRVLYRSVGSTNFASLYKNRRATYWKTAEFMMRRLADLHRDGWAAIQALDTYNEQIPYTRGIYRRPTNGQMLKFLAKTYGYRLRQKLSPLDEQWVLAFRRRGSSDRFTIIDPPADRFYADPFLAEHDGRTFVYFEDYSYADGKGTIACAELGEAGMGQPQTVIAGPDHLSYPSLFQWRGEWFMLPESGARRRVEIWRARQFPGDWALEAVALDGVDACDATLWQQDGRWWMFVTICVAGGPRADEVSLFHADTPLGPWRPHRANPIVSDAAHARPAGALYRDGGAIIRPSQDARGGYGQAITLNRIDRLTTREYRETPVGAITPTWHPRVRGTHTIARSSAFEVVDGRLLRFRRR